MSNNIEIIIGTYEEFLLGYRLNEQDRKITQSFADRSHTGALKCCAVGGKFIASGGTDDRVFIYDMQKRKQNQILLNHEGTVNAIIFTPENTHLLSAGDDGKMFAINLNNWVVEGAWKKAHNGSAVTHISCHPSGKLALTLGRDKTLRTWNLVKGRIAYKTNLKSRTSLGPSPDCLAWSPNGEYFILSGQRIVEIWSIKKADVWKSENTLSKPICVVWANEMMIYVGLEDGKILLLFVDQSEKSILFDAHKSRVKAICSHNDLVISACSSGEIKVWKSDSDKTLKKIISTNIGCRPTCMAILNLDQFGPDYCIGNSSEEITEENSKTNKKNSSDHHQRSGVVTIEYENDGNTANNSSEEDQSSDSGSSKKNETQEIAPVKVKKRKFSLISKEDKNRQNQQISEESKSVKLKRVQVGAFVRLRKN